MDPWNDVKDKFNVATEEFRTLLLEQHEKKKSEHAEWQAVLSGYLADKDAEAKASTDPHFTRKSAYVCMLSDRAAKVLLSSPLAPMQ